MKNPLTPLDFLARSAFVYGDRTAVVDGDRRSTYCEFQERVHRLAAALREKGVNDGDRVAVLALNSPMALEPHFAVPLARAILVMLNTRLNASELARLLEHCEAKVLLADSHLLQSLAPVLPGLKKLAFATDKYEELLAGGVLPLPSAAPPGEDDAIAINYTSGTTGEPKGVMYTHRGAYLNAIGEIVEHGLTCESVYLWTLPMFHCNGWCFTWAVTAAGARHICLRQADPARIVELIRQEGVTHLCGAPVVLNNLSYYCLENSVRFPHPVKIVTAGAPPSPAVIRAAEQIGADVAHVYGLTETYGPHSISAWRREWDALAAAERARLKARQGVPYLVFGTEMRVVDRDMQDVPCDGLTMGEVVMRGNNVMAGYYNNQEATANVFRGGWFHSGDLAVQQPDGYIEVMDRARDIVISGGENISSVEVEKTICEHPAVLEVAVIAMPDETWGEVPKAYVLLRPDHEATAKDIIQFCRERLAHFKCPQHVEFGPLPKTATGKVRKNELRDRAWAGRTKRVN